MAVVSRYGLKTCVLQVGTLWLLGVGLGWGLAMGGFPQLSALSLVPFAFGLFVLSFYRDPERTGPDDPELFLSPADGVVTDIGEVDEPHYLQGRALRVGIFLSPLNVHVNRVPAAGVVEKVVKIPGKCLAATGTRCIEENEAALVGFRTSGGQQLALRQVTGALARTIVCEVPEGTSFARGERYGMIKLGSRTELIFPVDAGFEPSVEIGQAVRGGQTVLGRLASHGAAKPAGVEASA